MAPQNPEPTQAPRLTRRNTLTLAVLFAATLTSAHARPWYIRDTTGTTEADFVSLDGTNVTLRMPDGFQKVLPLSAFVQIDQDFIAAEAKKAAKSKPQTTPATTATPTVDNVPHGPPNRIGQSFESILSRNLVLAGNDQIHITGTGDPISGSSFHFTSPDAWLFFDHLNSDAVEKFIERFRVDNAPAALNQNLRISTYGTGCVVIPHGPTYPALLAFPDRPGAGTPVRLKCHVAYDSAKLATLKANIHSLILRRGYMATIADHTDGSGVSRNIVAQDHDIVIPALTPPLDHNVHFVRVFPWRWTTKKGIAGDIGDGLNLGWWYNWNLNQRSNALMEYVPIRQKQSWPGLDHNWQDIGATSLLGFNEPDHKDQANMSVDAAIATWPKLLATGLRVGSPAVSDGGLNWLYEFMRKADAAKLRVDFVAVHYYRAVGKAADANGAASQFHSFLSDIHNRTHRPIWITEWNNGANWTHAEKPDEKQQKAAITQMIRMLDSTPFVERYALYNWVEDCRAVKRKDGSLTPAGEAYRDEPSPIPTIINTP